MSKDILAGIHAVEAAMKHDAGNVVEIMVADAAKNPRLKRLVDAARELDIKLHARDMAQLDKLCGGRNNQHNSKPLGNASCDHPTRRRDGPWGLQTRRSEGRQESRLGEGARAD